MWVYYFIFFQFWLLFVTFINDNNFLLAIKRVAYSIILILIMESSKKRDYWLLLKCLWFVFSVYTCLTVLTRILYPKGLFIDIQGHKNCWFLGYDNISAAIILTGISIGLIFLVRGKNKILNVFISVLGLGYIFNNKMATAIIMIIIYVSFVLINTIIPYKYRITATVIVCVSIIIFGTLQFIGVSDFFGVIFQMLGKNTTLTGRTQLWNLALHDIIKNGVIGYGIQDGEVLKNHFRIGFAVQLHSYFLQVLYEGGVIGFVLFCFVLFKSANKADSKKESVYYPMVAGGFFMMLVAFQSEAYFSLIMIFAIHLHLINNIASLDDIGEKRLYP